MHDNLSFANTSSGCAILGASGDRRLQRRGQADPMRFDQAGQALLLLTIQPADQSGEKKPQGGNVNHGGSLHQRPRW
jgi:hypothetical protein